MTRNTEQRRAIRLVFDRVDRPLTPQEVLAEAQKEFPSVGIATIYRNLKSLTESEFLKTVEVPGDPLRYERADLDHHHHFMCEDCNKVFDLHGCPGKSLRKLLPEGYKASRHEVLIYGTCPGCE